MMMMVKDDDMTMDIFEGILRAQIVQACPKDATSGHV